MSGDNYKCADEDTGASATLFRELPFGARQ